MDEKTGKNVFNFTRERAIALFTRCGLFLCLSSTYTLSITAFAIAYVHPKKRAFSQNHLSCYAPDARNPE